LEHILYIEYNIPFELNYQYKYK